MIFVDFLIARKWSGRVFDGNSKFPGISNSVISDKARKSVDFLGF